MKKKLRRLLLIVIALLFLLESWLWDVTGAWVAKAIALLPFEEYRRRIAAKLEHLSPLATLGVFAVPVITLLPFKFLALWLLAKGHFLSGVFTVIGAKLAGFGVFSFLFTLCKAKLLQLRAVRWVYEHCVYWRERAHALVKPYTRFVKRYITLLKVTGTRGKLLAKLRTRMHNSRKPPTE